MPCIFTTERQKSQLKKGRRRKTPELKSNGWLRRSRTRLRRQESRVVARKPSDAACFCLYTLHRVTSIVIYLFIYIQCLKADLNWNNTNK